MKRRVWPLWVALVIVAAMGTAVDRLPDALHHAVQDAGRAAAQLGADRADAGADGDARRGPSVASILRGADDSCARAAGGCRALPLLLLAPVLLGAWFARQNHFEWMFAPQTTSRTSTRRRPPSSSADDLVMAVERQGAAIAYPIRQLAYHHIVNDVVAGEPIVATY